MRFLMLNWRDPRNPLAGGAERVTQGYLSALQKRGHDVFWFAFNFPDALPVEVIDGITIVRGGGKGTAILRARQWYKRQEPFDLVIDQHHGIPWFAQWWCQTNCVAFLHEVLGPIWKSFYRWPLSILGRWQEEWTHRLYRNVPFWTASSATKRVLLEHGVKNVTIIPYGVHTKALPVLDPKPLLAPFQLAVVSRLAPNKRIDHAIQTLGILLARNVDAFLTIVGVGTEEQKLQDMARRLALQKRIVFAGSLPEKEKDELLRRSHLLLHTSQREGWGLNVIEANAMGTPAVVYPVDGLIESTLHRETGLVAESETPNALAASIAELLGHPEEYQVYRQNAWERAKTFHWDRVLPSDCDWLESMAQNRSQRTR